MLTTKVLRIRIPIFRFVAALLLVPSLPVVSVAKTKIVPPADSDYVRALGAANDFLHAWQTQDREAGILLLTDRLKQRFSEGALVEFFSRRECRAQSFEIARGKKLAPGRYRFPVSLFQQPASAGSKWIRPQTSSLVVVRTGASEWSIDKLP
ncbi:MAG TPA: hypothetical protein VLL05_05010 [Terriglobales bacterium]|nr:hypothetical protein [Terriglobales bacterium]